MRFPALWGPNQNTLIPVNLSQLFGFKKPKKEYTKWSNGLKLSVLSLSVCRRLYLIQLPWPVKWNWVYDDMKYVFFRKRCRSKKPNLQRATWKLFSLFGNELKLLILQNDNLWSRQGSDPSSNEWTIRLRKNIAHVVAGRTWQNVTLGAIDLTRAWVVTSRYQ